MQLIYQNQESQERTYFGLLSTSINYFQKAYVISNFLTLERLIRESRINMGDPNIMDGLRVFHEENLIDRVKIIMCFENYLKGVLIGKGYLVHLIDKSIAPKKFKELGSIYVKPIRVSEYIRTEQAVYKNSLGNNTYRALKKNTIGISALLSESSYQNIHKTPTQIINIIKRFNFVRNTIHFRWIGASNFDDKYIADLNGLIRFVNENMITEHNRLVRIYHEERHWSRLLIVNIEGT